MQTLFRSYPTASFFEAWGMANGFTIDPLYTDDATHTAIVNEESQYEERWTIKPHSAWSSPSHSDAEHDADTAPRNHQRAKNLPNVNEEQHVYSCLKYCPGSFRQY